ncbi:MAG: MarR family transcriptional regulator [Rhodothermales bacterium]|nr:MarR family transcriptional regulator [Rhodothermales bacterium]
MPTSLSHRLKQRHFVSPSQESMLHVMVTSSWLLGELTAAMSEHGVTPAQYNVLRILRGSHPTALKCSDVRDRLIDRTPDVTRLLARLERQDLSARERAKHDRRIVEVRITKKGLDLLDKMEPDVEAATRRLTENLTNEEHAQLSKLLEKLQTTD